MPIARFQMPDGRIARFEVPEGTTPEQAADFASSYFEQDPFAELEATPQQPPKESGLFASLESGARGAVGSGLYGLGELTGLEGISKYGEEILQGQPGYAPITSEEVGKAFEQGVMPGLGAGAQYVTEATGEVAGGLPAYIATALGGAKTGAALMPIPQFKPAAALAGSVVAPAMTYFFGQNRLAQEEQIRKAEEEGVPPPQFNDLETFGYGLLQSGVERTGIAVLARRFPVLNRLFGGNKADAEAAARELAEQGRAAAFGRGAAAGVVTEVPVELTQQVLERQASGQDLTSDEALAEYVEVMKRTAAGIAPIGGVTGVASRSGAISRQEAQQRQAREQELAEMRAQATEAAQTDLAAVQAREFAEEELPDFGVGFASTGLGPTVSREGIVSDIRVADEEWDVAPIRQRLQETADAVTQLTEQSRKAIDEVERNQLYDELNMARTENILAQAATYREAEQRLRAAGKQNEANGAMRKYYSTLDKAKVAFDQVQNQEIRTELGATLEQVTAKPEGFEPTVTEPTITTPAPTIAPQAVSAQIGLSPRSNAAKAIDQLDINTPEGRAQAREIINAVRDAKGTSPKTIERIAQSPLVQELDAEVEAPVDVDLEAQADLEEPSGLEVDVTEPTLQEYARMWAEAKAAKNQAGADVIRSEATRVYRPTDFDAEIQSAWMQLNAERGIEIARAPKSQIEIDRDATWSQNQDDDLRANLRDENTLGVLEALKRNENPVIAAVAQRFDEIPTRTPAVTIDEAAVVDAVRRRGLGKDAEIGVGGMFDPMTNTVTMRNELAAGNPEYVTHELTHAQASMVLKTKPVNQTDTQRAGVEQLKKLYEYVKENTPADLIEAQYALTSVDEFLSEGMGNKRFQDYLKTVEYKNTNAWSEFVAAIAKMLGLKPDTAFTELLSAYEQITTRREAKAPPKTEQVTPTKKRKAPADVGTPETLTEAAIQRYAKAYKQARKTDKFPGEEAVRVRGAIEKAVKEAGGKKAEIAKVRGAIAKAERLETEALTRPEREKAEAKAKQEQKFREREEAAQVERQKEIEKGAKETEKLQERERQRRARGAGVEPTDLLQASIERQLNELRTMAEAKRRNEMRPLLKKIIARVRELNPEWRAGDSEAKIIDSVLRAPSPVGFMRSIRSQYDPMYQAYLQGSLGVDEEMGLTETDAMVGGMRQDFERQMARMEQVMTETDAFNDAEIDEIMAAMRVLKNPKSDPEAAVEAQEVIQKYDDIVRAELAREEGELMFKIDPEATRAAEERVTASGGRIFSNEQDRKGLLNNMKDFGFKEEDGQMVRKGASDYIKDSVTVTDWVATKFLSSDSAVVNGIRRRLREMSVSEHEFLGSMLNASTSQVWHAEALGAVTLEFGNLRYNEELHKYEGILDVNNYKTLIGKLEEISKDRGIPMNVIESDAHRYVEAKRLLAIRNEQELIQRKIDALNKSGRISNKRKAQKLQKYADRYIHMTDDQIRTALEAGKAIPEYNDVFKIWDGMRKNVIKVMVDSGLVDQYEAEVWLDNSDYVPFYRESQLEAKQGPKEYISGLTADPNLKRFKGTDADVNNVFDNMAKWIEFYVSASVRNNSARRMLQEMRRVGMARAVDPKAKLSPSERERRVGVWEKGEKNFYVVDQPIFLEAFKGMESAGIPVIGIAAKFTDLLRKTVVLNPIFSLAQLSQDSFGAMFTSGLPLQTAVKLPIRVVKEFINTLNGTSASHSELRRMGAVGVRDYNAAVVIREAESFLTNMQDAKAGPLRRLMRGLENFSMASDNAVRQAIYELSQENGATKAEAIEKAFEVINFRRKGSSPTIQLANRLVPFFNAYLQALSVQQKVLAGDGISPRNKKSWNELAQNMAAFTALSIFMALMLEDDEEYQRMEPYVRNRMWYLGNGFGLPIRTDLFLLPKIIAEEVTRMAYDSASADPGVLKKAIKEGLANGLFGPTAVPQILKPTIEVAIDHSFHTGRALTPAYAEGLQNEFQYNEYTSELSKLIGAGVDGSPILIEHWLRGTFGSAAGLMMWTSNLWGMGAGIRPPENFREIATSAPGMGRFMSREFGGGLRSMFYDAAKLSNEAKSTYTTLSTRDPEGVDAWLSEDDNLIRALSDETLREYQKEIGKIRREIRDVSLSTQLDNDFKQEYLRELRAYEQIMLEAMDVKGIRETLNM